MNDKLRSTLHTAWEEPRHFFFWLTLLGLLGFVAIAVGMTVNTPNLLLTMAQARVLVTVLAFAALGCILGVVVGIPCFILAWIPPVRRGLASLLWRRWLALACFVTLIALFYAVEDWRGRHAWLSFKREREAKGERFDLTSLAPPAVPNDQNFFETPLWQDLRFVETNGTTVLSDTNCSSRVIFSIYGPNGNNAPNPGSWLNARRVDLAAWQAFYRGSNNLFAVPGGPATNYFPIAQQSQSPAADVLLALSRFETNRQLLIAAAARPSARFWIKYDAGSGLLFAHLPRMKACAQYLALHANAALKAGDQAAALEDLKALFRLVGALRQEPLLISQLVNIAVVHIGLQPVWEGLADRQWTEANLKVIESELGHLDFLADYQHAMRGERACAIWAVDYYRQVGLSGLNELVAQDDPSDSAAVERVIGRMLVQLVPAGWSDQNKLSLCGTVERYLLPAVDLEREIISPTVAHQLQKEMDHLTMSLYDMLSRRLMPALASSANKFARAQTAVDFARIACALERYRLANGQFPDTLQALTPKFIAKLPHDVINGQPLNYHRTDDGQFVLYSVGANETDDGGKVELTKSGNIDMTKGDWVWRYPAR